MKLQEILSNDEAFDIDKFKHELNLLCNKIYKKITKPKPGHKKMEVVVSKGRGFDIEEQEVSIKQIIFVDDFSTAPYYKHRNSNTLFLDRDEINAHFKSNDVGDKAPTGWTHKKFGFVCVMSDGDEFHLGGTIENTGNFTFKADVFTGGMSYGEAKDHGGRVKEIEIKKADFKKINKRLETSDWNDLTNVILDTYESLNKVRIEKLKAV